MKMCGCDLDGCRSVVAGCFSQGTHSVRCPFPSSSEESVVLPPTSQSNKVVLSGVLPSKSNEIILLIGYALVGVSATESDEVLSSTLAGTQWNKPWRWDWAWHGWPVGRVLRREVRVTLCCNDPISAPWPLWHRARGRRDTQTQDSHDGQQQSFTTPHPETKKN